MAITPLFIRYSSDQERNKRLTRITNTLSINSLHLIDYKMPANNNLQLSYNLIDLEDIQFGRYKNFNFNSIPPVDDNLRKKYYALESEFLLMAERFVHASSDYYDSEDYSIQYKKTLSNRYFKENLTYNERINIYLKHLRFWNNYLISNNITHIIFPDNAPHSGYDLVIYHIAKFNNIKFILSTLGPLSDYRVLVTDFYELKEVKNGLDNTIIDEFDQFKTNDFKEEWKRLNQETTIQKPKKTLFTQPIDKKSELIKKFKRGLSNLKSLYKNINLHWIQYQLHLKNYKLHERVITEFYAKHCSTPKYGLDKFIYIPLHYQPEMTTCPMGGIYANQLLMIEMISYYLPEGYWIYVKEHPFQKYKNRDIHFYSSISRIKKVKLISKSENSYKLLDNCIATATATGTAGWEGLFKNKPFLMFGFSIYQFAPGVITIRSNEDCRNAINQIINNNSYIDIKQLKSFLLKYERISVKYKSINGPQDSQKQLIKILLENE